MIDENSTIREAIEYVEKHRDNGLDCPVCEQFVKVYPRKLSESQIRTLYELAARNCGWDGHEETRWVHINSEIPQMARDFATVSYFLLAEQETALRPDGGRTGYWRVTREGVQFLKDEIKVKKYALVYNNEVLGYEGDAVGVQDVAPEFNLRELMAGV